MAATLASTPPIVSASLRVDHSRVFGLDVLRAFAICTVVYNHGAFIIGDLAPRAVYDVLSFDGVSIFFVLSGFLIGSILLKTSEKNDFGRRALLTFWIRRWFRTLPNYFLVLTCLIAVWHWTKFALPHDLYRYFVFSQDVASPHPKFFGEAWSLAVEEWFYLLIPIVIYLGKRFSGLSRHRLLVAVIGSCIVAVTCFRIYRAYHYGYADVVAWDLNLRKQVITRFDSLMFGVFAAYLSMYRTKIWLAFPRIALCIGCLILIVDKVLSDNLFYLKYLSLTVGPVGTFLLLPFLSTWRKPQGPLVKLVTKISEISYSMYLLNYTAILVFVLPRAMHLLFRSHAAAHPFGATIVQYVMFWTLTVLCSYLLWRLFEMPMMRLRDRF